MLTEHEGVWTNAATNPHWQWLRCAAEGGQCVAIEGATKETYKVGPEDVGHSIEVVGRRRKRRRRKPGSVLRADRTSAKPPVVPTDSTERTGDRRRR